MSSEKFIFYEFFINFYFTEHKIDLFSYLTRKKMSQADLAKALDTTPANVNRLAKGDGVPSYELCVKLLEQGITTEELFGITILPEITMEDEFDRRVKDIIIRALQK